MESSHHKSKAWLFITVAIVLLGLFLINSLLLTGEKGGQSTNSLPLNSILSFFLASAALTLAVAANVAAYMNPASAPWTRTVSPIVLATSFISSAPFFVALGLTLIS